MRHSKTLTGVCGVKNYAYYLKNYSSMGDINAENNAGWETEYRDFSDFTIYSTLFFGSWLCVGGTIIIVNIAEYMGENVGDTTKLYGLAAYWPNVFLALVVTMAIGMNRSFRWKAWWIYTNLIIYSVVVVISETGIWNYIFTPKYGSSSSILLCFLGDECHIDSSNTSYVNTLDYAYILSDLGDRALHYP